MPEDKFSILQQVATPVFVLDVPERGPPVFRAVNPAHTLHSGLTTEDVRGKSGSELFRGEAGEWVQAKHQQAADTGKPLTYLVELPFPTSPQTFLVTLSPVMDDARRIVNLIGTLNDVSEEAEYNRIRATREEAALKALNESKEYIAMAAHDLRSPMRQVAQLAEYLREEFADAPEDKIKLIDMLDDVGVKAFSLITDVLAFTSAHEARKSNRVFEFGDLCSRIFSVLDPQRLHRLIHMSARIEGDEVALQIVLRNLLDNALKHGGKAVVEVDVSVRGLGNDRLLVKVQDNGKGFDDPAVAFLDGGDFRCGSGFGLLGIRRLVAARGGEIRAAARPDRAGAVITFTIPGRLLPHQQVPTDSAA